MAYAAVASLVQTLEQLLLSDHHQSPLHYPKPQIESLHKKLCSLQSSLEEIFPVPTSVREKVNNLETEIRDLSYEAQDTIESFLSRQIHEPEENIPVQDQQSPTSLNDFLQEVMDKIDSSTAAAEEIARSINKEDHQADADDDSLFESAPPIRYTSFKIVGQEKEMEEVMEPLISGMSTRLQVVSIIGMAGIGKTTLARSIFEDALIAYHYDVRAWVTVSQHTRVRDIFLQLLGSTHMFSDELRNREDDDLMMLLYKALYPRRYLIVIDDLWHKDTWDAVSRCLPDSVNGSRILLTTRFGEVATYANPEGFCHQMSLLDGENSWKLLCKTVFGEQPCPPQLETAGRRIAYNCKGLPLSVTVVGGLLSKQEKTVEYWEIVAEDTTAAAAKNQEESYLLDILALSYNQLPGRLKACFLYMGAFPEDSEILVSKLIQLWVAEGFLSPPSSPHQSLEQGAEQFLKDLIDRNLISAGQRTSLGHIKTCRMHDAVRDLAEKESEKQKFFYSIYRCDQHHSEASRKGQRRLAVHNNILMSMEDVYKSAKSFTHSRTLLYVGPHHHHPLPYCLTFELLRVLDALTVYFISFPNEIVKLIHLRYLSMTYNGKLPKSVTKLRNLQVLIIRRHPKIILSGISFLPVEIWNMPQLRHILFTETCLPDLSSAEIISSNTSALLANLQTLSNVNASCLTKEVLQNIPNLKKLVVWIEEPTAIELDLSRLQQLESFKFTVLNPEPELEPEPERDYLLKVFYPKSLKKLTLSGCGFPWDDTTVIGQLPDLQVLKLRESAFRGKEWEPKEGEFRKLKILLLEYLDVENWVAEDVHFPRLEQLIIKHCYELKELSTEIGNIGYLKLIEMVDCSRCAMDWAEYIKEVQEETGNNTLQVRIYSSLE